jgi:DNA-binding GntR family transcriptional regulator
MKSEALVRPLLRDRAYNELRALIVAGTLAPGSFLSERKLSDRLGMSKTPIKAALALLESEGFVLVSPQQGIVVREIAVESYICRRLAGNLATEQEKQLRTNIARQRIAVEKVNHSAFNGLDAALHLLIAGMSENREIIAAI